MGNLPQGVVFILTGLVGLFSCYLCFVKSVCFLCEDMYFLSFLGVCAALFSFCCSLVIFLGPFLFKLSPNDWFVILPCLPLYVFCVLIGVKNEIF